MSAAFLVESKAYGACVLNRIIHRVFSGEFSRVFSRVFGQLLIQLSNHQSRNLQMNAFLNFRLASSWAAAAFFALQTLLVPAYAQSLPAADAAQVRTAVQGQLDAFAKDDAEKAFSFAAPNIRKTFGSAATFMSMVRRNYPVVYRPASSAFLTVEGAGNQAVQRVQMQDAKGDAYLAIYTLERQKNKTWRITGCQVIENKGQTA